MINELALLMIAVILAFCVIIGYMVHIYRFQKRRADGLQEYITIKRWIRNGRSPDTTVWKYYDVTRIDDGYRITLKNYKRQQRTLTPGGK